MFEKSIRGGITEALKRYARAYFFSTSIQTTSMDGQ